MNFSRILIAIALITTSVGANASLITNGSFESGLTGWTYSDIDVVGWDSSDGALSLDLSGSTFGSGDFVAQTVATTIGEGYELTFDYAANPGFDPFDPIKALVRTATLAITGQANQAVTFDMDPNNDLIIDFNQSNLGWISETINFIATSTNTTVSWTSPEYYRGGIALDNVALVSTSVPAPLSLALFGLGLLGLGALRKRA